MQKTICQQLNLKVEEGKPFKIYDQNNNHIYLENSNGSWFKSEFDQNNNEIYLETSTGFWSKREFDQNNNRIYFENSDGYWNKSEFDQNNNRIYFENSEGEIEDNRPKVVELTLDEIASKFGINVENLKIKK